MDARDEMKTASGAVKLTYDDFVHFPNDGKRHELIDGEHYVTPSPRLKHQAIVGNLYLAIGSWLESHPVGRLFLSPLDVVISEFDVVEPDLLFVSAARVDILTVENVRGTPDLVIEVGSRGTRKRDETIKKQLYQRAGVLEYWIVDPEIAVVRVYRREGLSFLRAVELSREHADVLRSPVFPGLDLPLERVFRDT
jgi:Uma2 family endonuclease